MTVVIVGSHDDPHACAVEAGVRERGVDVLMFDTHRFPDDLRISLRDATAEIRIGGVDVVPSAVYIRDLGLDPGVASQAMTADWRRATAALRERGELVLSIIHRWEALGVAMYNAPSTFPQITKPHQIALLAAAGLPVPASLWTNDPDDVRRFAADRRVAYKPVAGGAHTRELEPRDLDRLHLLAAAPVCFQELLPGRDLRVYVLDGEIVAALAIETGSIDFRLDERAVTRIELDAALRATCLAAAKVIGVRWTGMDLKADAHGRMKLLELNSSPMFLGFDRKSGSNLLGALCAALSR